MSINPVMKQVVFMSDSYEWVIESFIQSFFNNVFK